MSKTQCNVTINECSEKLKELREALRDYLTTGKTNEYAPEKVETTLLASEKTRKLRYLSRDAMPPSVRSCTLVYFIETAKDIIKLFSRTGDPIILVFKPERRCTIPRGFPSAGTLNKRSFRKIRSSRPTSG